MLSIDLKSRTPLYQQIITNIEELVARGIWAQDMPLPSVRQLAVELAINPNTIQRAYAELEARGVIYSLPGRGSFVSEDPAQMLDRERESRLAKARQMIELCRETGLTQSAMEQLVKDVYKEGDAC